MSEQLAEEQAAREAGTAPVAMPPAGGRLSRTAILLGLVSLCADVSSEMMYPLLPIFLSTRLKVSAPIIGLIEGVAEATGLTLTGLSGWFADRIGRYKQTAFLGYVLTALAKPTIAFASTWPIILGARFTDRLGKGVRAAPRDALLAESVPEADRGRAFGFERMMDSAGAVAGPLIAIGLVSRGMAIPTVFLLTFIPAGIAALLLLLVREEPRHKKLGANLKFSFAGTLPTFRRLLLVVAIFSLGNSTNAFLILRAQSLGLAVGTTILCYTLYNVISSAGAMPAGIISDRVGRRNLLILGYCLFAIVYFGFGLAKHGGVMWALFALYGLYPALTDGVGKAMAVDAAGTAGKATVVGIYSATLGLTQFCASLVGGQLWVRVGPEATFYYGGLLATAAAVLAWLLLPRRQSAK